MKSFDKIGKKCLWGKQDPLPERPVFLSPTISKRKFKTNLAIGSTLKLANQNLASRRHIPSFISHESKRNKKKSVHEQLVTCKNGVVQLSKKYINLTGCRENVEF